MPRFKSVMTPEGQTQIEIAGDELAVLEAAEATWTAGAADRAWAEMRQERNRLLAETDWWASSDLTMSNEQKLYRVQLRDLPANTADPANPTWPSKP